MLNPKLLNPEAPNDSLTPCGTHKWDLNKLILYGSTRAPPSDSKSPWATWRLHWCETRNVRRHIWVRRYFRCPAALPFFLEVKNDILQLLVANLWLGVKRTTSFACPIFLLYSHLPNNVQATTWSALYGSSGAWSCRTVVGHLLRSSPLRHTCCSSQKPDSALTK